MRMLKEFWEDYIVFIWEYSGSMKVFLIVVSLPTIIGIIFAILILIKFLFKLFL